MTETREPFIGEDGRAYNEASPAGWRPIETAPKDGTHFLAYGPAAYEARMVMAVMSWVKPYNMWAMSHVGGWEYDEDLQDPSHWMPLPEPPEKK